jgi:hypothetical protein
MPRNPNKRPCSVPGCRAWAIRDLDPPRCAAHTYGKDSPHPGPRIGAPPGNRNHLVHGFYATIFTRQELADLVASAGDTSLDAEIAIARVALRRILHMLVTGHTPAPQVEDGAALVAPDAGDSAPAGRPLTAVDYARFIALAFQGVSVVARLLRARHDLGGAESDPILAAFGQVLDELGEEWQIDL